MAKFDLTSTLGQYLDRHLVFPLLEFISAKNIYDETELLHAKLDIISKTKMVDYLIDIRNQLHPDEEVPEDLKQHRANVVSRLGEYQNDVNFVYKILTNDEFMNKSENTRDSEIFVQKLKKEYNFDIAVMPKVYQAAKYSYECGNYTLASSQLYFCSLVLPPSDKTYLNVLWGKLATEILIQNWNSALEDLNKLREYIDSNPFGSALQLLQQRTWLIHWSLFVFYNHEDGKSLLVEMFLYRPHYLNAIQTMCPHILRYLATAVITSHHLTTHSHRNVLKDLVKVIQQESYTYRDPITEFLEHLYVNFDFEGARQKLHECQTVLFNDFFVTACLADFVENARLMIFETFCRIHKCISIGMLAEKLNMNPEEAECWIVDLIRSVHLDAKIDSKLGHVVMGTQALSPYQQLVDKIDSLAERSEILHNLVIRKLKPLNQEFRWGASEF